MEILGEYGRIEITIEIGRVARDGDLLLWGPVPGDELG